MRIVQVVNAVSGGGAERLVLDLHRTYLKMGHESTVVALSGKALKGYIRSAGFSTPYHPMAARAAAALVPPSDVVHVHLFPALITVPGALRRKGYQGPVLATEHSTSNRRRQTLPGRLLDLYTYRPYSRIICISSAVEEALLSWKPRLAGRTTVINNGVFLDRFSTGERKDFHSPAAVLTAGRIAKPKNLFRALEAVRILTRISSVPFVWTVAGDGPLLGELRNRAGDLLDSGVVRIPGHVNALPELMARSDIFFMPSLWEGFGIAAVEAMASGLPVVASDVPGLRDVVGTDTGILVDPLCQEAMVEALENLLQSQTLAISMGNAGRVRSLDYSIEKCAEEHIRLFSEAD